MDDLVTRLRNPVDSIETMKAWDSWRKYIAEGGGGSWPRDAFECLISGLDEECGEAADRIESLSAELAHQHAINDELLAMLERVQMRAESATPEAVVKKLAQVANAVAWQAGVGGIELAGQFVSVLAKNPEKIAAFISGDMDIIADDILLHAENGCLTWHSKSGHVISPEQLRAAKASGGSEAPRTCKTCANVNSNPDQYPCSECSPMDLVNWTPKPSITAEVERRCKTCAHAALNAYSEPCDPCLWSSRLPNWTAKPNTPGDGELTMGDAP